MSKFTDLRSVKFVVEKDEVQPSPLVALRVLVCNTLFLVLFALRKWVPGAKANFASDLRG